MSTLLGEARVRVRPDTSGFESEAKRSVLGAAKRIAIAAAGIMATAGVADVLKDSVMAASDLGETQSKVGQIFGKSAKDILAYSKTANTALGQTQQQALDANATFGVFGKSAGLTGKELSGFTTRLTSLSADLASFHNTSPEEAIDALGAALRGEAEPMRRYGVLLDDATMRQQAVKMGLIDTTKTALTPANKVLAAQALILKQTKDAQGDFARTSGGLANQQRILAAQWGDMKVAIGKGLLPAVLAVVKYGNQHLIPFLYDTGHKIQGLYDVLVKGDFSKTFSKAFHVKEDSGLTKTLLGIHRALKRVFSYVADHKDEILAALSGIGAAVLAWKTAGVLSTVSALGARLAAAAVEAGGLGVAINAALGPIGWIALAIGALVAAFVLAYKKSDRFREVVTKAMEKVKAVVSRVKAVFMTTLGLLIHGWKKADPGPGVSGFFDKVKAAIKMAWPYIKEQLSVGLRLLWEWIKKAVPPALRWIGKLLKELGSWILHTGLPWLGKKLAELGKALVDWIGPRIMPMLKAVAGFLGRMTGWLIGTGLPRLVVALVKLSWKLVTWIAPRIPKMLWELGKFLGKATWWLITKGVPKLVGALFDLGVAGLKGLIKGLKDSDLGKVGGQLIDKLGEGLTNLKDKVVGWAKKIKDKIVGAIKSLFGIHSPSRVMANLGGHMVDGLLVGLEKGRGAIHKMVKSVFGNPLDFLKSHSAKALSGLVHGVSGFGKAAVSKVGSLASSGAGWVKGLFGGGGGGGSAPGNVQRWLPTVMEALSLTGQPLSLAQTMLRRLNQESGGNAHAINLWDSNAKMGTPSKGLMQVIDPTFQAYRLKSLSGDIYNPLANMVASIRYAVSRYGNLATAYNRSGGYDSGGVANGVGFMPKATLKPERVLSPSQSKAFEEWMRADHRPDSTPPREAPLFGGDLNVSVGEGTTRDGLTEALFQVRRARRGGVHRYA